MNAHERTAAITVDHLTKRFGKFTAVDAVTFDVAEGEVFGFLGPNGAGKTTTIKMLAGLLLPSEGRGTVAGFDIAKDTRDVKRSIGYMSQLFSLYADLTVEENIAFFSGLYGVSGARAETRRDWVLEMAGLRRPSQASHRRSSPRLEAAPGARMRRPPRAAGALPGRAHLRRRPDLAPRVLGSHLLADRARAPRCW